VVSGQLFGIGALVTISFVAALLTIAIPPAYVDLLGFAPMGIGLKKLLGARSDEIQATAVPIVGVGGNVLAVAP